jgi:hypothetical protein
MTKSGRRMMMKIKRVGTISMGVMLIAFGVILFLSLINKFSALNMVLKMWPVVLILIGLEVLWYRYASKDEGVVIKYDLFSIFLIFIILILNIGIFAVNESGLFHRLESMFLSVSYDMDMPIDEYIVDESINRIIIDDTSNLVIRATSDNKISGIGKLNVYASSKEEADELAGLNNIKYEKSGNVLYIYSANNVKNNYSYSNIRNLEIFLPENIDVEVVNCYNLDLIHSGFNNKWLFDGVNNINIRLDKISNVTVKAFVESLDYLSGNIKWSFDNFGEYVNGDGANAINILNGSSVIINEV